MLRVRSDADELFRSESESEGVLTVHTVVP